MDIPDLAWQGGPAPTGPSRSGIVDLGSNSVRLVIFEGLGRNPQAIFNEKAVLGLGRGLQSTGRLNDDIGDFTQRSCSTMMSAVIRTRLELNYDYRIESARVQPLKNSQPQSPQTKNWIPLSSTDCTNSLQRRASECAQ